MPEGNDVLASMEALNAKIDAQIIDAVEAGAS